MSDTPRFEWDPGKAELNFRKHDVRFQTAMRAFEDDLAIHRRDPLSEQHGEERFLITGMAGGQLLTVVYTVRSRAIRLISARKATRQEHDNYYRQDPQE
jgi:uncharacterized DUF497 family protein